MDVGAGTVILGEEREGEAKIDAFGLVRASTGTLLTGVALGLTDGGAVVFRLEKAKLLEREKMISISTMKNGIPCLPNGQTELLG